MPTTGEISLYFHIPFCTRKCPYCHFYVAPDKEPLKELLLESLALEWDLHKDKLHGKKIISIYFGGGTPALFGPRPIKTILSWIDIPQNCEITLEANPEEMTLELMQAYKECGINRVSIGVQSLDDQLLKVLGRRHSSKKALESIQAVYEAGISDISIDLMYEIPHQTLSVWQQTLRQLDDLPITHLSLYNLTIEPHTAFFKQQKKLLPYLPSSEACLDMLNAATAYLEKIGLKRYEISAFAKGGKESCHNTGYWQGRPFLGFGPSAFSYWNGCRFRNIANLNKYAEKLKNNLLPIDFEETLSETARSKELLAIALRRLEGVSLKQHPILMQVSDELLKQGWITLENERAKLTPSGLLFYDSVAEVIVEI